MRFSIASRSLLDRFSSALGFVGALGASAVGCTTLLGDFSSGASSDGGLPGSDGQVPAEGGPQDSAPPDSAPHDAGDASVDTGVVDGGGDDADAAPWSPTTLDGEGKLALWLEASASNIVITNGLVGLWNDLTHNANNAANTSGGPQVQSAAVNGHDAVHFTQEGTILTIQDAPSLQFGTDQFVILAVAHATGAPGYFFSKAMSSISGGYTSYVSGLEFVVYSDTNDAGAHVVFPSARIDSSSGNIVEWSGPGFEDGAYHLVTLRRPYPYSLALTVDSQATQTGGSGQFDVSQAGRNVEIGGVVYGNALFSIDISIAEMLVIHSTSGIVADADVASVQAYLKQKFAL